MERSREYRVLELGETVWFLEKKLYYVNEQKEELEEFENHLIWDEPSPRWALGVRVALTRKRIDACLSRERKIKRRLSRLKMELETLKDIERINDFFGGK